MNKHAKGNVCQVSTELCKKQHINKKAGKKNQTIKQYQNLTAQAKR